MEIIDFAKSAVDSIVQRVLWITSKQEIFVIHESDLRNRTSSTDICVTCGQRIDMTSVGGLIMSDGQLKPFCTKSQCNPIASLESSNES